MHDAVTESSGDKIHRRSKATLLFRSSVYRNKYLTKLSSESDYALVREC